MIQKKNTDQCPHCKNDVKAGDESVINAGQAYHRKCWDVVKGEQQVKCTNIPAHACTPALIMP